MLSKYKIVTLLLCEFCMRATYFLILPILPFVVRDAGLKEEFVGYVFAFFGIGSTVGSLAGGKVLEYVGRKSLLLTSFVVFALLYIPVGAIELMEDKDQVAFTLLAGRLVQGFCGGCAYTALCATFMQEAKDDEQRQNLYTLRHLVDSLGLVFGPIIGAFIYSATTSLFSQALGILR